MYNKKTIQTNILNDSKKGITGKEKPDDFNDE